MVGVPEPPPAEQQLHNEYRLVKKWTATSHTQHSTLPRVVPLGTTWGCTPRKDEAEPHLLVCQPEWRKWIATLCVMSRGPVPQVSEDHMLP